MRRVVRGLMVTACAAATVTVAACGSTSTSQPAPTTPAPVATSTAVPSATSSAVATSPDRHGGGSGGGSADGHGGDVAGAAPAPGALSRSGANGLVYDCTTTSRLLISGSHDSVTLVGTCEQLTITGSADTVTAQDVVAIRFTGDDNRVTFGGGGPQVADSGLRNVARKGTVPTKQAAAPPAVAPGTIGGSGTFACSNRAVTVSASGATVTLTGTCAAVTVRGRDDTVHVAAVASITVTGSADQVLWHSGPSGDAPTVHNSGTGNTISHS